MPRVCLLHVYAHAVVHMLPIHTTHLTWSCPQCFWQTLLLSQQLQKLKYSSLMRCLQQLIYFDSLRPAVKNIHIHGWSYVMEKEHLYKSICYTQTHCLLFFSVILAASATKWSDCQGFRTITILQSPLCPFLLGLLGLCPGLIHHKG